MQEKEPTSTKRGRPKLGRKKPLPNINFRVEERRHVDLSKRAKEQGMSAPQYARAVVFAHLDNEQARENLEATEKILKEVTALREDMALVLEAILVNLTSKQSKGDIRKWIDEHLRREEE
jgi:hypothetical protein